MKAELEYARYQAAQASLPQPVDLHFAAAVKELKQIAQAAKTHWPGGKPKGDEE